ncbi:MAG TPA: ATP-binding cassette domain-containing protein [Terriglobales bacterium]|nr:ATP-binding cassette domain-containing protein [Terriglobales bacterium]
MNTLRAEIRLRLSPAFQLDCIFEAPSGFTVLFGQSGAGKTSVLDCIAGIKTPHAGKISLSRTIVFDSRARVNCTPQIRKLAYVFQELALFPHMTVSQNVSFGLRDLRHSEVKARCDDVLSRFRIGDLSSRKPRDLSGGERQRVALARSLITDPRALLLDEPLAALDRPTRMKIVEDLRTWNDEHKVPILYVTHSVREALALGERVLIMEKGKIVAEGKPSQLLNPDEWD